VEPSCASEKRRTNGVFLYKTSQRHRYLSRGSLLASLSPCAGALSLSVRYRLNKLCAVTSTVNAVQCEVFAVKQAVVKQRKFRLKMKKNFFPLRVTEPCPRLPSEAVESPSLEIFKTHLDKVLCSLLWVTMLWQEGWPR